MFMLITYTKTFEKQYDFCWMDNIGSSVEYYVTENKDGTETLITAKTTIRDIMDCAPYFEYEGDCHFYDRIAKLGDQELSTDSLMTPKSYLEGYFVYNEEIFFNRDFIGNLSEGCLKEDPNNMIVQETEFSVTYNGNKKIKIDDMKIKCCSITIEATDFALDFCVAPTLCNTVLQSEIKMPDKTRSSLLASYPQ